jgi:NTP pyrophosphatase (non-canonical NTP hydrolase)
MTVFYKIFCDIFEFVFMEKKLSKELNSLVNPSKDIATVGEFIKTYNFTLTPYLRFLDLVSELGEFTEVVIAKNLDLNYLKEEVGDLYYSILALCFELKVNLTLYKNKLNQDNKSDLTVSIGKLAKVLLNATNYGKSDSFVLELETFEHLILEVIEKLNNICALNSFSLKGALLSSINKYKQRFEKYNKISSS